MIPFILTVVAATTLPLALWLAYRMGHKINNLAWDEAIEWSDDPAAVREAIQQGRRRIEKYDEYVLEE